MPKKIVLPDSFLSFTKLLTRLNKTWINLTGDKTFSLQSRIYNSICIITIVVIFYSLILSLFINLGSYIISMIILLSCQIYLYYLSRYKGKTLLSFIIYAVIINLFFSIAFILHSGIQGSSMYSFFITYFLIIAIVPRRQYWFWTISNVALVAGLIFWEYYHPEMIQVGYLTRADRFIDIGSTYVVNIILTLACLSYIINNYNLARETAENNASTLARLNKQKNELISIISHDFNAPLNNINSYLFVLKNSRLDDETRQKLESDLGRVTFDTQNLLLNLLSWAKSNIDGMRYRLEPVNVSDALKDTLRVYGNIANQKLIQLENRISDEITVTGNFEMIEIIFRNLISNAIKFTPEQGKIILSSEKLNGYHIFSVSDSGLGISPEKQPFVFSADLSATFGTNQERGVGLGLKICHEFVQYLSGEIWFDTQAGKGTTFYIKFLNG